MRIRPIEQFLKEEMNIEMPQEEISGEWFTEHNLPMIVSCQCCHTTMALPSAMVDDNGNIFCSSCC